MFRKLIFLLVIMAVIAASGALIIKLIRPIEVDNVASDNVRIKVVATFYPMYLIGLNIANDIDDLDVKSLTKLNTGCLHDYQLTTKDMKNISQADVLIINGGGMEGFVNDVRANYPKLTIIDASQGITMPNNNPHVWLDPALYIHQIENVRDGLTDYIHSHYDKNEVNDTLIQRIDQNATTYINKVSVLDTELGECKEASANISSGQASKPEAVIFHDSFAYLADRVGIPVAFTVPLDSDTSLSAGEIADIVDKVKTNNIRYLFTEEQYSNSIAKRIEAETDAKVYIIDSGVTGDGTPDSYLKAMENNIIVVKEALSQ